MCITGKTAGIPHTRSHSLILNIQPETTSRSSWWHGRLHSCAGHLLLMGCTDADVSCVVGNSCSTAASRVVVIPGEQESLALSSGRKLQNFRFQSLWFGGITGSNPERFKQGLSSSETNGVSCSKSPIILFVRCCVTLKTAS